MICKTCLDGREELIPVFSTHDVGIDSNKILRKKEKNAK